MVRGPIGQCEMVRGPTGRAGADRPLRQVAGPDFPARALRAALAAVDTRGGAGFDGRGAPPEGEAGAEAVQHPLLLQVPLLLQTQWHSVTVALSQWHSRSGTVEQSQWHSVTVAVAVVTGRSWFPFSRKPCFRVWGLGFRI
eukprot:141154-Prorocentrum_minimum.AAC.1